MPQRRVHLVAIVLVGLTVAVAGCVAPDGSSDHPMSGHGHGDDDHHHGGSSASGEGNLAMTGDEDVVVNVTGGAPEEYRFTPDRIEVQSGQRVGIVFTNDGNLEHEFSIDGLEFHLHAAAGDTEEGAFIAPAPGTYEIGCYIPGHFESGMKGTLVVT